MDNTHAGTFLTCQSLWCVCLSACLPVCLSVGMLDVGQPQRLPLEIRKPICWSCLVS